MSSAMKYGLVGDSSLYTKRNNKKKSYISTVLRDTYRFANLTERIFPGGRVRDLISYLKTGPELDVLGVSYFGNEHTLRAMDVKIHRKYWQDVFRWCRKVAGRVVFFIGGYAAKYTYGRVYDENLNIIKRWIKDAGFQVVEARQEVSRWELAADKLHFSVECLPELAAFWSQLLMPRKFVRPGKRKERLEPDVLPEIPLVKKARKDPRDKWLLPAYQKSVPRTPAPRPPSPDSDGESSDDWTKGQERAARLERDKKKLNDELAMRRMKMLKARGLLPPEPNQSQPRRIPPRQF